LTFSISMIAWLDRWCGSRPPGGVHEPVALAAGQPNISAVASGRHRCRYQGSAQCSGSDLDYFRDHARMRWDGSLTVAEVNDG